MKPEYYSPEGMRVELEEWLRYCREDLKGLVAERIPMYLAGLDYDKRSFTAYVDPSPWMADRTGNVSNGAFTVALDQTMGILGLYVAERNMTPTVTLQLSLLRPIPLDRRLYIEARLLGTDGTKLDMAATAWSEGMEDQPVCSAVGIYYAAKVKGGRGRPDLQHV